MAHVRKPEWITPDIKPLNPETELLVASPPLQFGPCNLFRKRRCVICSEHLAGRTSRALTAVFRGFSDDPDEYPSSLTIFVHDDCGRPDPQVLAEGMLWAWRQQQKARRNEAILSVIPTADHPVTEITDGQAVYTLQWKGEDS